MLEKIKGNLNLLNSFVRRKRSSKSQNECSMHERFCVCQGFTFLVFFRAYKFFYNTVEIQVVLHNDNFLHIINVFFLSFHHLFSAVFLFLFFCLFFILRLFVPCSVVFEFVFANEDRIHRYHHHHQHHQCQLFLQRNSVPFMLSLSPQT